MKTLKPNDKGIVLANLLSLRYFAEIQHVIFVDDSLKNLEEVQAQLPDNVGFLGIHYTAARDALLAAHEPSTLAAMGTYQHSHLKDVGYLLSDQNYEHESHVQGDVCAHLQTS